MVRHRTIEAEEEDDLPLTRRRMEENPIIIIDTSDDEDHLAEEKALEEGHVPDHLEARRRCIIVEDDEDEYWIKVFDEDNDEGEEDNPTYNPSEGWPLCGTGSTRNLKRGRERKPAKA